MWCQVSDTSSRGHRSNASLDFLKLSNLFCFTYCPWALAFVYARFWDHLFSPYVCACPSLLALSHFQFSISSKGRMQKWLWRMHTEKKEEGLSRKAVLSCAKRPTGNKVTTRKKMGSSILKLLSRIWLGLSFFSLTYTTKKIPDFPTWQKWNPFRRCNAVELCVIFGCNWSQEKLATFQCQSLKSTIPSAPAQLSSAYKA